MTGLVGNIYAGGFTEYSGSGGGGGSDTENELYKAVNNIDILLKSTENQEQPSDNQVKVQSIAELETILGTGEE